MTSAANGDEQTSATIGGVPVARLGDLVPSDRAADDKPKLGPPMMDRDPA